VPCPPQRSSCRLSKGSPLARGGPANRGRAVARAALRYPAAAVPPSSLSPRGRRPAKERHGSELCSGARQPRPAGRCPRSPATQASQGRAALLPITGRFTHPKFGDPALPHGSAPHAQTQVSSAEASAADPGSYPGRAEQPLSGEREVVLVHVRFAAASAPSRAEACPVPS